MMMMMMMIDRAKMPQDAFWGS